MITTFTNSEVVATLVTIEKTVEQYRDHSPVYDIVRDNFYRKEPKNDLELAMVDILLEVKGVEWKTTVRLHRLSLAEYREAKKEKNKSFLIHVLDTVFICWSLLNAVCCQRGAKIANPATGMGEEVSRG